MTARHLLAVAVSLLFTDSLLQAENQSWSSRKIQLTVQRNYPDAPVPTGIAIRPGKDELAVVGDDHLVRIKERSTGRLIRLFEAHSDWIKIVRYHPNGETLYTAGDDRSIIAWNSDNAQDYSRFAREDRAIEGMTIDSKGEFLATIGFNNKLYLYDLAERKRIRVVECPCSDMRAIQFSPDGEKIAMAGRSGIVRIIRVSDGSKLVDLPAHKKRVRDLAFVDNNQLLTVSDDQTVQKHLIEQRQSTKLLEADTKFYSLAYLGSMRVAVGSSDNLIRILDAKSGSQVETLKGHTGTVCELVAQGGELVSGAFDTEVRVWQTENSFVQKEPAQVPSKPALTSKPAESSQLVPARKTVRTQPDQKLDPSKTGKKIVSLKPAEAKEQRPASSFQVPSVSSKSVSQKDIVKSIENASKPNKKIDSSFATAKPSSALPNSSFAPKDAKEEQGKIIQSQPPSISPSSNLVKAKKPKKEVDASEKESAIKPISETFANSTGGNKLTPPANEQKLIAPSTQREILSQAPVAIPAKETLPTKKPSSSLQLTAPKSSSQPKLPASSMVSQPRKPAAGELAGKKTVVKLNKSKVASKSPSSSFSFNESKPAINAQPVSQASPSSSSFQIPKFQKKQVSQFETKPANNGNSSFIVPSKKPSENNTFATPVLQNNSLNFSGGGFEYDHY